MNRAKQGNKTHTRGLKVAIGVPLLAMAAAVLAACGDGSSGSGGAAHVSVPNVAGDTQTAATTAITGAGLKVGTLTQAMSSSIPKGDVVSENPAAGSSVASGSTVALVISTGPETYSIGGILIGLGASATVHVLNGADDVPIAANGAFTLPTGVASGGNYGVTVGTPTSAQTCAVQNGSGTAASGNITNVVVYCTYTVTAATLNGTYTAAFAEFASPENGSPVAVDADIIAAYDGMGAYSGTSTVNNAGLIVPGYAVSGTYAVSTAGALPSLTNNSGAIGGIEGINGDSTVSVGMASGAAPGVAVAVLPNTSATTASINGNYTLVDLTAQLSNGSIYGYEATITLTNGAISGTYTQNIGGTITTGNPASGQWSVANGTVTAVGSALGAVSADGDLIVLADTNSGDDPYINIAVLRGSGVTEATFEGVYSVVEYGGTPVTATFDKAITLFAYANGTFSAVFTKNANGTITTNNTATGTYTVATDGTMTLIDAEGDVYNGAISADGNALVLASVASQQNPAIFVGVRQ
ncbi:MAG: PASTA domain-containing protein [Steroidobacteraceae bacterium]